MRNTTLTIKFFSVIFILGGLSQSLTMVDKILTKDVITGLAAIDSEFSQVLLRVLLFAASTGLIKGICAIMLGMGVLWLKDWARSLMLVFVGFNMAAHLVTFAVLAPSLLRKTMPWVHRFETVGLAAFCIEAITLWYFLRPSVKAQFISKPTNR